MAPAASQPQDVGDRIPPRLLIGEPFRGPERAVDEGVAIGRDVRELQPFPQRREVRRVPADFIADAQRVHTDLAALA